MNAASATISGASSREAPRPAFGIPKNPVGFLSGARNPGQPRRRIDRSELTPLDMQDIHLPAAWIAVRCTTRLQPAAGVTPGAAISRKRRIFSTHFYVSMYYAYKKIKEHNRRRKAEKGLSGSSVRSTFRHDRFSP